MIAEQPSFTRQIGVDQEQPPPEDEPQVPQPPPPT